MKAIWAKDLQLEKNCSLAFVLSRKVDTKNLEFSIVATNIYRLFINGELAGYGPARACHNYVRKDNYDISSYITGDELKIVVEVFGSNVNNFYVVDEPPFFAAEVKEGEKLLFSTEYGDFKTHLLTDRVVKVQRYSFQRPFTECYNMEKCRTEFYNGDFDMFPQLESEFVVCNRIIDRYAPYPEFSSNAPVGMVETGVITIDNNLPKWNDRCLHINDDFKGFPKSELEACLSDEASAFTYKMTSDECITNNIKSQEYRVYDFGRTITGFFKLDLKSNQDSTIYIIWDEIDWAENAQGQIEKNICFYRNSCCNVIKYNLKAGEYHLLNFEATSARFVKIIVTVGEIDLDRIAMISYENPEVFALHFESNDEKLNAIVKAAQNTLSQNAVDILMDCPSRERAGWLCDAYFSARAEKLMSGKNVVEKSFLENYILAPQLKYIPDGMIPMCYPSDNIDGGYIPNWGMWFVVELRDYYRRTGDRETVEKSKGMVYRLLGFFDKFINTDGLLENLEGWIFIEWSMANDAEFIKGVNYPSNMMFSKMLSAAATLFDDENLSIRAKLVKDQIIKQSYNGKFFEDNKVRESGELVFKNHITETCQYYAFFCSIASKEDFPDLFKTLITDFGPNRDYEKVYPEVHKSNAFIGNYLRLEILLKNGLKEQVINESKDFFYFMAQRTGTLWEHSFPQGSLDHGFASVAANYIIECLTGLTDIDFASKTVYMSKPINNYQTTVRIPVPGGYTVISTVDGEVNVEMPEGYTVKNMDK